MQETPQATYSYNHILTLIDLHEKVTGKKPKELFLTKQYYTWFIQESARDVDNLKKYRGIEAKLPKEPQINGVLIKQKLDIVTPKIIV